MITKSKFLLYAVVAFALVVIVFAGYFTTVGKIKGGTTLTNTTTISPGGSLACPMSFYQIKGSVVSYSRLFEFNLKYGNGTIPDYVVAQGTTGILNITESIGHILNGNNPNLTSTPRSHGAFIEGMGPGANGTTAQGIVISTSPASYTIENSTPINFLLEISVNQSAPNGTYWAWIDGPCDGGLSPILITAGAAPYNGTVSMPGLAIA